MKQISKENTTSVSLVVLGLRRAVSTIGLATVALLACGGGKGSSGCESGTLGCSCRQDGTCDSGLTCDSGHACSALGGQGGSGEAGGASGGTSGQGNTAGGGVGQEAGAAGTAFAACSGYDLTASGALDLNLRAIHISGAITLAGAPLPDEAGSRGQITFVDSRQGAQATVDLGSSGASTYALTIPPGRYDVQLVGNAALCHGATPPIMPCGGGTLMTTVDLMADGVLDVDIPVARLNGVVTLNGEPFPTEVGDRGALQFVGPTGATLISATFEASGAASYTVTLLPGKYDVGFVGNPALCQAGTPPHVPCNSALIRSGVDVATGNLDVDVGAVTVTGAVTLAGGTMPDESLTRGAVSFTAAGAPPLTHDLGASGPAGYAVTLLPGVYDVGFEGNSQLCLGDTASHVPCNAGTVFPLSSLTADGVLNLDLDSVTISGAVTLNGSPFPTQASARGAIGFLGSDGALTLGKAFGTTGAVGYQITLLPGDYAVAYQAAPECSTDPTALAPCNGGTVLAARPLTASGVLDVDIPSVQIAGAVTVNGAQAADEELPRGALLFSLRGGGSVATSAFAGTGAMSYGLHLLPGEYAVGLAANPALCGRATPSQIPCVSGTLLPEASLTGDGVLDVDIPSIQVGGAVTLLGAPLPAELQSRGSISFSLLDGAGSSSAFAGDLGAASAGVYGITLLPGRYVVSHSATATLCGLDTAPQVPCASQVILGCD